MHGCVVDQKLPYLYNHIYMRSNACMLAARVCTYVAHMFQKRLNPHDVQLALHKKDGNKWSKNGFRQNQ